MTFDDFLQPRFVVNRVTAGDYDCPRKVLSFLTDLHASFRMLNLRNDFLRKKFDGEYICFCTFISSIEPYLMICHRIFVHLLCLVTGVTLW